MSKAELSTIEDVLEWVHVQTDALYYARDLDTETAAYLVECVRLRVAFDKVVKADPMGWPEGERIILKHLRDAMKGGDK